MLKSCAFGTMSRSSVGFSLNHTGRRVPGHQHFIFTVTLHLRCDFIFASRIMFRFRSLQKAHFFNLSVYADFECIATISLLSPGIENIFSECLLENVFQKKGGIFNYFAYLISNFIAFHFKLSGDFNVLSMILDQLTFEASVTILLAFECFLHILNRLVNKHTHL